MGVRIIGLEAVVDAVREQLDLEAVKTVIAQNTSKLQEGMMRQTYDSFKKGYSVGDTRRTIELSIEDGGLTGKVEATTKYSEYVEYGTRFMEAEPFVRPSFQRQAVKFKRDIDKLVR